MARQRMVKPEFFDSESLGVCSVAARLAFIGLWVEADDYGRMKLQPNRLKTRIFPYDRMSLDKFEKLLAELENVGCIRKYTVDGEKYLCVPNFNVYQTVNRPSKSNIPEPPQHVENDVHNTMREDSVSTHSKRSKGSKGNILNVSLTSGSTKEEGASVGAAAAKAAPPSAPRCPLCGTELTRTGMQDEPWWCDNCQDSFMDGKVAR